MSPYPKEKTRTLQKGIREKLLCWDCEQKLSPYEKYVRELLYGGVELEVTQKGQTCCLRGINYQKVRIFYLSVLWRMRIASHHFFEKIDLGPHEEKLRIMVYNEDPREPDQYGFLCFAPLFDDHKLGDWMIQPDYTRLQQHRVYRALVGGLLYLVLFRFVWVKGVYKAIETRYHPVVTINHRRLPDGRTNPFYPGIGAYEALERC